MNAATSHAGAIPNRPAQGPQWVQESTAIDMDGPYLVTQAVCPLCGMNNRFSLLETRGSSLRENLGICAHIHRHRFDDEGVREFGFEHWREHPRRDSSAVDPASPIHAGA